MRYDTGAADDIAARRLRARQTDLQAKNARSQRRRFVRRVFAIGRVRVQKHRKFRLLDTRVIVSGVAENVARRVGHINRAGITGGGRPCVIRVDLQFRFPVLDVEQEGVRPNHGSAGYGY